MPPQIWASYANAIDRFAAIDTIQIASGAAYAQALGDKRSAGKARSWMNRLQMIARPPITEAPSVQSPAAWKARMIMMGIHIVDKEDESSQN